MKFLCDVHLPKKLVAFFITQGIEAVHGSEVLNGWQTKDKDFCKYSDENDFIFITKDYDFRNSHFLQNTPLKLIKISLGNISNENLISTFNKNLNLLINTFKNKRVFVEINKDSVNVYTKTE